jgi:O-antigen/teichoic acid export membrane protein
MSSVASVRSQVVANYLGQGIAGLMSVAFIPIYLRELGAEGYGVIGLFTLLQAGLLIIDLSIAMTLGREIARHLAGEHSAVSIRRFVLSTELLTLGLAIAIGAAVALGANWLARDWVQPRAIGLHEIENAVGLMGIVLGLRLFEGLYRGCLVGLQRPVVLNLLISGVATLRWGGAAACLLWMEASVTAYFAWQCAVSTGATVLYALTMKRALPTMDQSPRPSAQSLWNVRTFFAATLSTYALGFVVSHTDKIILSKVSSLESFGHYTFAALVASVLSMVAAPVIQALYPRLTVQASQGNLQALAETYHFGSQLLNVFLTPPAMILIIFGPQLVAIWTGDAVMSLRAGPVLQILALGTLLNCYMGMPHVLQLASGWAGLSARMNMLAVVLLIPAITVIAPRYGPEGTAWAWVGLNASYVAVVIPVMHQRLLPVEMKSWYWNDVLLPALGAAVPVILSRLVCPSDLAQGAMWAWLIATGLVSLLCAAVCAQCVRQRVVGKLRAIWAAQA